ncbi:hypothetical protein BsWGS_06988 [Bradybaena similaris]
MDGKQFPFRFDALETNAERQRPRVEKRKENPFIYRDSSVDPVNAGTIDKVNRFPSPRYAAMEQQPFVPTGQVPQEDSEVHYLEQSERMERKLQQSIMLLNQKQQVQHKLLLIQQQQIQQQQQLQQQRKVQQQQLQQLQQQRQAQHQQLQQLQQQRQLQHQFQTEQPQLSPEIVQQRSTLQRSPERQRPDSSVESQTGYQKPEHSYIGEAQKAPCSETPDNTASVQDLYTQCQSLLDVINACTDLQQTIKDEMKKQAKLDNIICQKLVSKAQRLQQQASILEKAHAPSWVAPALLDLGAQVTRQAEVHHIYTATLIEQCVVIQHSLDGHHELMKSVLAEHSERKQKPVSLADVRSKSASPAADKRSQAKVGDEVRSMTFLQASNIFEDIRKPRMKLLSTLEYQQEQLNATIMHLAEVDAEIEGLTNEDSDSLMWRTQIQKKDLEIRKEFLETRKEQLESDVQFAKMDVSDFEFSHKDSLLEVLNVFRQHRIGYDTTLRKSFQLLKAASLRDLNYLRWLTKKSELDGNTEFEPGDTCEGVIIKQNDPWSCASKTATKLTSLAIPGDNDHDSAASPLSMMYARTTSPQVSKKRSPHLHRNTQEQIDSKITTIEQTYPIVLSSDSELSDVQKSGVYSPELKPVKLPTVSSFSVSQFQNVSDYNFSRTESSYSLTEPNNAFADEPVAADVTKAQGWRAVNEKLQTIKENRLQSTDDGSKLIISRYIGDVKGCENQPVKNSFHSGTEDMVVVSCGPKPRITLGNFENSVDSECSMHCLYPMSSLRENPRKREEKRVSHLINKYASGSRSGRASLGKNWNSCKPMLWSGVSRGGIKDNVSRRKMHRSVKYCKVLTRQSIVTEYNENSHVSNTEPLMAHFQEQDMNNSEILQGQSMNNSDILQGQNDHESFACSIQSSEENMKIKSLHGCNSSEPDENIDIESLNDFGSSQLVDGCKHACGVCNVEHNRHVLSMCDCEPIAEQHTDGSVNLTESMTTNFGEDLNRGAADSQSVTQNLDKCEQIPEQESRNLKKCEHISGQENRNLNKCEQIPMQESKNLNKCEHIPGQENRNLNKCEQIPMHESKNLNKCEHIPGQESKHLNKCEQIPGQESKHLNKCEQIPGQESRKLNRCEQIPLRESKNLNKCEHIPMLESKNLNKCEQLPGHESRNLNNCEPLINRAVDAEVVAEREDQMEFEVIQPLCPDSQPRQVRVCAVRPISSELDRGGSGQTIAKGLTSEASSHTVVKGLPSEASEEAHPRRGLSCKYENLKVYEITAGQFTISELETDCKSSNTMESNKVDRGNFQRPGFNHVSSQVLPNQDCLQRSDVSSCKNHACESRPHDALNIKTGRKSVFMNCEFSTSANTDVEYSVNMSCDAVMCRAAACADQFTYGEDTRTASINAEATIRGRLSVPELHPQATSKGHNLQSTEFTQSDTVYGYQNNPANEDQANNKCDEDQTFSKTLYRTEQQEHVKQRALSDSPYKLKDATGLPITSYQQTLHECSCARTIENHKVIKRQLTRNVPIGETRDESSEVVRTISSQIMSTPRDALVVDRINCKEIKLFVEDGFRPKVEIHEQSKAKIGETATSQAFYKSMIEMSNLTSKQASCHINLQKEYDTDERHSLTRYNQDYTRKPENEESRDETNVYINNTQQQAQHRPLKSNLKKSCAVYTPGQLNSGEAKESCESVLQCGALDVTAGQLIAPRETDKIHKCIKQVRFDHKIHYDDNTVTDSLDITISEENDAAAAYPANTNKNCAESISVQQEEILMYSAIRTSYFTNNHNSGTGRDKSLCDFSNNRFSLI